MSMIITSCAIGKIRNNYKPKGIIVKNNLIFQDENEQ